MHRLTICKLALSWKSLFLGFHLQSISIEERNFDFTAVGIPNLAPSNRGERDENTKDPKHSPLHGDKLGLVLAPDNIYFSSVSIKPNRSLSLIKGDNIIHKKSIPQQQSIRLSGNGTDKNPTDSLTNILNIGRRR